MQCVSKCNYSIYSINTQKKELFGYLLSVLPKENTLYAYSKKDLKFKREAPAREAIQKGNFLYYNKNYVTELIFDIDNISNTIAYDLELLYKVFYEKFGIAWTWSCKTDRGVQFCISINTFYKLSKKQLRVIRDFKEYIINNFLLIDRAGSKRLKGWWRNPFKMKEFKFYGNRVTFKEILDFLHKNNLDIKKQFKNNTLKRKIKNNIQLVKEKKFFIAGEPKKGNRNKWLWYNTMFYTCSKNFNEVLEVVKELHQYVAEPLEEKELIKIAKSVTKYNNGFKNGNEIYGWNIKASWNIGVMGFEKITGLNYEDFKKEVKRRQQMAGKRNAEIGTKNLIKAVKKKAETAKNKVYTAIEQLKKENKRISALAISKISGVSRNTAIKYLKQAREEGLI